MTLSAVEFNSRFLHLLSKGLVRIRHYGLYSSAKQRLLAVARQLLGQSLPQPPRLNLREVLDLDRSVCPICGQGRLMTRCDFDPLHPLQMWLVALLGLAVFGQVAT